MLICARVIYWGSAVLTNRRLFLYVIRHLSSQLFVLGMVMSDNGTLV